MSEDDLEAVAAILEDEVARTILAATNEQPMSVNDLAEQMDTSKSTIYRRIERLEACELVDAQVRPDTDGHHEKVFSATFDRLTVELDNGDYTYHVERTEPMADRLMRFIEQL